MINTTNNIPSFKAREIAIAKTLARGVETKITLYETGYKDKAFLTKLLEKIKMKDLMPNLTQQASSRWQDMLEIAVEKALLTDRKSYVAVVNNKPCGILACKPGKKVFELDCICTWPIEFGKKVNAAGKTLFNQLFKTFDETGEARVLKLDAITDGPFDTINKYKKLGFIITGGEHHKVQMETNAKRIKNVLNELRNSVDFEPITNGENVNLLNKLDI